MFVQSFEHSFDCLIDQTIVQTLKQNPDTSGHGPEGMQGERRPQSGSLCRRVQGEGHSLLRGAGGRKPLAEGPGRVIPAVGFKGERPLPL